MQESIPQILNKLQASGLQGWAEMKVESKNPDRDGFKTLKVEVRLSHDDHTGYTLKAEVPAAGIFDVLLREASEVTIDAYADHDYGSASDKEGLTPSEFEVAKITGTDAIKMLDAYFGKEKKGDSKLLLK